MSKNVSSVRGTNREQVTLSQVNSCSAILTLFLSFFPSSFPNLAPSILIMSNAYSRVFDIPPELVDLFTSYLSPADLLVCVQVNSHWNKRFIPKLWHTIDDTLQSWEQILFTCHSDPCQLVTHSKLRSFKPSSVTDGKDEDWLRAVFAKYGQYIRKLKIHWAILVDAASTSGVCTNLQDLEIKFQWSNAEKLYWSRRPKGEEFVDSCCHRFRRAVEDDGGANSRLFVPKIVGRLWNMIQPPQNLSPLLYSVHICTEFDQQLHLCLSSKF